MPSISAFDNLASKIIFNAPLMYCKLLYKLEKLKINFQK